MADHVIRTLRTVLRRLDTLQLLVILSIVLNLATIGCLIAWEVRLYHVRKAIGSSAGELRRIEHDLRKSAEDLRRL